MTNIRAAGIGWLVVLSALALPDAPRTFAAPAEHILTVNSTLDQIDINTTDTTCQTAAGTCTLRAAIMQADAFQDADVTIMLPAGTYLLTRQPMGADGPDEGDLNLTAPASVNPVINLVGAGAATTIIDGLQHDRVFKVDAERTANISGVTIRHGSVAGSLSGGGILNSGALTVNGDTLDANKAYVGGGIENSGTLTVIDSSLVGNMATNSTSAGAGGGIDNIGTLNLTQSTLSGNTAAFAGGGIFNYTALFVTNSTLSQNNAKNGGGIFNAGTANVYNTTIVFNRANFAGASGSAGGVYNAGAAFNLRNTLLAGNSVTTTTTYGECYGTLSLFGPNLIGTDAGSVAGCAFDTTYGTTDYLNSLSTLGPLQSNGGPTQTNALLAGSSAIDAGDPGQGCVDASSIPLATDQRGFARVVGLSCDIGAFEYLPPILFLPLIRR